MNQPEDQHHGGDQTQPGTPQSRPVWERPNTPADPGRQQTGQPAADENRTERLALPGQQTSPQHTASAPHQQAQYGAPQQQPAGGAQPTYGPGAPWGAPAPQQGPAPAQQHNAGSGGWPPASADTKPRRGGSKFAVPVAALLAAVLASGGTYALTHDENAGSAVGAQATTKVVEGNPADFVDAGTTNWSATAQKVIPSVVSITATKGARGGRGSGVVLDTKGNIVTNNHVVNGAENLSVTLSDNRSYKAEIVGTDPSTDLAVIKLSDPPSNLKPIELGDDANLVVGQPTMAVGNPLGLAGTVTTGIVSALNRPVSTQESSGGDEDGQDGSGGSPSQTDATEVVTNAIQTSAAINPGNSGGALVNGSGKLIGINSSIASLSGSSASSQSGNIGIGFAIPVTVVKNITQQLIANGKARHALLGVSAQTGTVELDGATLTGAKVASVAPDSGAAKAGLKNGDVILSIDGDPVESSTSLVGQVRERTVDQRVALSVVRDGKRQNVTVTLGAAPTS